MTTCARSLSADLLRRASLSGCLHQDRVGPLVQDLCMRISCACCLRSLAESCRSARARSVYENLLRKMSVQKDLLSTTTCARSLSASLLCISLYIRISARPLVEDLLPDHTNAILPAFRAIDRHVSAEGYTSKSDLASLATFCVMDTRDLRRGLHFEIRTRIFTSILCDGHARSPQRVGLRNQK